MTAEQPSDLHPDLLPSYIKQIPEWPRVAVGHGKTICLDFDGVIHSYSSGWKGIDQIPDPPVPDAFQFISDLLDAGYTVAIYSSRSQFIEGIAAMSKWFRTWGFQHLGQLQFPSHKPPAFLTIDDRAIQFSGIFPPVSTLADFKPWNK